MGTTNMWALGDAGVDTLVTRQLARMIQDDSPSHFLYLGDVYQTGLYHEFMESYDPIWGSMKDITWPICGNHCWGDGKREKHCDGWKQYWHNRPNFYHPADIEGWMVLMLDSEMECEEGTPQWHFVHDKVASWDGPIICGIHRPRWSAGSCHGDRRELKPIFKLLKERSCLVLSGHEHSLQSLKPQGKIKQLIIGAGGHEMHRVHKNDPRLEWGINKHAALRLSVSPDHCDYEFRGLNDVFYRGRWNRDGSEGDFQDGFIQML